MNRPVNRIISFLTAAVYVWLYAIVIYFTLSNRMLLSFSGNVTGFFNAVFLGDGSESALGHFFVAVFAVMLLKTAVGVLQKDISRQTKIRILSMNIIYLLCLCIFAFFLGNTAGFTVFAIISAAVLILTVYVNFAETPDRARSASPNTAKQGFMRFEHCGTLTVWSRHNFRFFCERRAYRLDFRRQPDSVARLNRSDNAVKSRLFRSPQALG